MNNDCDILLNTFLEYEEYMLFIQIWVRCKIHDDLLLGCLYSKWVDTRLITPIYKAASFGGLPIFLMVIILA